MLITKSEHNAPAVLFVLWLAENFFGIGIHIVKDFNSLSTYKNINMNTTDYASYRII